MTDPRFLWDAGTHRQFFKLLWLLAGLAGLGVVMGYFINVNKFSLHALYRNRLIRAYPRRVAQRSKTALVHRVRPG